MSLNDVLPLKAVRRDAFANLKCFGAPGTNGLILIVSFTFTVQCHLIRLTSTPLISSSSLAKFGWVSFAVCNAWRRSKTENLQRVSENCGPILTRLLTKLQKSWSDVEDPSYFPTPLPVCLYHVSFSRYSSLRKPNKRKTFWPPILGRLLARFTIRRLAKFGWVLFADLRLEAWQRIEMHKVGKNAGLILCRLWTKVHDILTRCRRPLVTANALARLCIPGFSREIQTVKFAAGLRHRRKNMVLGPQFLGRWDTSHFGHDFSSRTYFWASGRFWLSSVHRAPRVAGENKRR